MQEVRRNEFKDLLEMNELMFVEHTDFIKVDIPELGACTYYPKKNRLNIHKGNKWESDGFYFVKNNLNITPKKTTTIRDLIVKYFDKHNIEYSFDSADYIDDVFSSVEEAITEICNEFVTIKN